MEPRSDNAPLIAIVGETASGKSALALELAQQFNGEIVCADSRTIFRGLDIGTAKPSRAEQEVVPHHMIDVADPDQRFTAADFKQLAAAVIKDIQRRGKVPLLVGGTGLYIDAVLYDFSFAGEPDLLAREELQTVSVVELQQRLQARNIPLPANTKNPRHLIRALETAGAVPARKHLRPNTLVLGLQIDREILKAKLIARVDAMVAQGFVEEARQMAARYGWDAPGLQAPGYKAFRAYIEGATDLAAAKAQFVQNDVHLAKRQRTWFKRNSYIHWISKSTEAVDLVTTFLNK